MGYGEKYCIWSSNSIGGCPLEEASEQERIPSIIGSIVCVSLPQGFCLHSCVEFSGEWFGVYYWFIVEVYL
jgi:hypothetical protein